MESNIAAAFKILCRFSVRIGCSILLFASVRGGDSS